MKENFKILREKFNEIKNIGLIESMRYGTTGIGYTFETLLGKKEDSECFPDFCGIEIKTKLGYSKSPMTLFNCIPKRNNESAINYILNKYSWNLRKESIFVFSNEIYCTQTSEKYGYNFKLKLDYLGKRIIMQSYKNNILQEDVCYWDFNDLNKKLNTKLKYLAIIYGYPYKIKNKLYYKYLKMNTYKLKGFFEFLKLVSENKISIQFYLKRNTDNTIENHGVSFRIDNNSIEDLFFKLFY